MAKIESDSFMWMQEGLYGAGIDLKDRFKKKIFPFKNPCKPKKRRERDERGKDKAGT